MTTEYHKIDSLYKRDPSGKQMLLGQFSRPEFEYLRANEWVFTEKVDGTNIRVIVGDGLVGFGGKTDNAQIPSKLLARLQERFLGDARVEALKNKFPDGAVLYGEGYGPGIQSGGTYRQDQDFVLFDVLIGGFWLLRENVEEIATALGLDIVPIIGRGDLSKLHNMVSVGHQSRWGQFMAEGIVARPATELKARNGGRIITKLKYKDFSRSK